MIPSNIDNPQSRMWGSRALLDDLVTQDTSEGGLTWEAHLTVYGGNWFGEHIFTKEVARGVIEPEDLQRIRSGDSNLEYAAIRGTVGCEIAHLYRGFIPYPFDSHQMN